MSVSVSASANSGSLAPRVFARLACLVLTLAAFVVVAGPPVYIGRLLGWRFAAFAPVLFQRLLCAGLGVRVRRHGELSPAGMRLIVANHVSWLDIPVLGSLAPMAFLAKKEIGSHPVGRRLAELQGVVYVDREKRSCIPAVNASIVEAMRSGTPVVLFAEATTGDGNRLLQFRSSHFQAIRTAALAESAAFIQPVFLDYSRLAGLPILRKERPRIAWYGDMTFLPHFFRYARSGGVTCDVHFGPAIRISADMDRKSAARLTQAAVRKLAAHAHAGGIFLGRENAYIEATETAYCPIRPRVKPLVPS
ncbi:MAG TPA: lysophospholipid acyltransferase family protein [Roseiarcus sp.]|nr:lysophospholipid acyltransferase family protein [Roseiarcus sp.]